MAVKSFVDANYRFIAASQEVNARITQRQQALSLYVTMTIGLLAALASVTDFGPGRLRDFGPALVELIERATSQGV